MREKAKQIFLELKEKNAALQAAFDEYVAYIQKDLDIPERIAINLVTTELVNKYEKSLILRELFGSLTLDEVDI